MLKSLLLCATLACCVSLAKADVPPKLWYGAFPVPVIACDMEWQIAAIAHASNDGHDAMVVKFKELAAVLNKDGLPACAYGNVGMIAVGDNIPLPDSKDSNDKPVRFWAVHVGNSQADFWILYAELVTPEVPKTSDSSSPPSPPS